MQFLWLIPAALCVLILIVLLRTLTAGRKSTYFELSKEPERIDAYAEKLSKLVQVETVSSREDPQIEKFRGMHKVMAELFPTVFEKLEKPPHAEPCLCNKGIVDS